MSYTPHTWSNGETITAAKLNAIEQAIAGMSSYDAEVLITRLDSSSPFVGTIVSGSFAALSALTADDIPPNILVRVNDFVTGAWFSHSAVVVYYAGNSYINFDAGFMTTMGFQGSGNYIGFQWNSNDTLSNINLHIN